MNDSILHFSDIHLGEFNIFEEKSPNHIYTKLLYDYIDSIFQKNSIKLIIVSGDFFSKGKLDFENLKSYSFISLLKKYNVPILPCIGNHDYVRGAKNKDEFESFITNSLDWLNVENISINDQVFPYVIDNKLKRLFFSVDTTKFLKAENSFDRPVKIDIDDVKNFLEQIQKNIKNIHLYSKYLVCHHSLKEIQGDCEDDEFKILISYLSSLNINHILSGHLHDYCIYNFSNIVNFVASSVFLSLQRRIEGRKILSKPLSFNQYNFESNNNIIIEQSYYHIYSQNYLWKKNSFTQNQDIFKIKPFDEIGKFPTIPNNLMGIGKMLHPYVSVFETRLAPNEMVDSHLHDDMIEFHFINNGNVIYYIDDQENFLESSGYIYIPPFHSHTIRALKESKITTFSIQNSLETNWEKRKNEVGAFFVNIFNESKLQDKFDQFQNYAFDPILEVRWYFQKLLLDYYSKDEIKILFLNLLDVTIESNDLLKIGSILFYLKMILRIDPIYFYSNYIKYVEDIFRNFNYNVIDVIIFDIYVLLIKNGIDLKIYNLDFSRTDIDNLGVIRAILLTILSRINNEDFRNFSKFIETTVTNKSFDLVYYASYLYLAINTISPNLLEKEVIIDAMSSGKINDLIIMIEPFDETLKK